MGVSEIGFPQNVVYRTRIQTSDTLPVTIGASKYCEFLFDIDAGDRMTPLGIVGWGCNDKTQVFLLDFYMDNDLQTAKLILKNPYATTIAINSLYIDVLYSKQGLDMSEVDVVDNLTTDSAVAALSAKQGKLLNDEINQVTTIPLTLNTGVTGSGSVTICGRIATVSAVLTLQAASINMGAAWIPGQSSGVYAKYLPSTDRWISCDFYMSNVTDTAEALIDTDGVIKVSTPISGRDLKISGTWVTKG